MQPTSLAGRRSLVVALVALAGGALAQTGGIFQCEDRDGVFINPVTGQECVTTIQTAVPFLTITPDARAGAMGDVGVATSPTAASTFFNGSALAFADEPFAVQATYTPWLRALGLNDVYLLNLAGYGKLDELQTLYGSVRYFSLGEIAFTDINGQPLPSGNPNEFAITAGYSRLLTDKWSASIAGRFILSSLASGLQVPGTGEEIRNGMAGAADLGVTYRDDVNVGPRGAFLQVGASIRNIGSKITYTSSTERDFLPTNLGVGASLETFVDDYNSITFALDVNKLLVPSPQPTDSTFNPANISPVEGLFRSFGDAEGGFAEEMEEFMVSVGAEYWYADQFAARAGYFHEANTKGGRRYLTLGVGLKLNVLGIDFSYLVPTTSVRNPLDNTLRFGLTYRFRGEGEPEGV